MPERLERGTLIRRLAPISLMPPAAFAVHQLRYMLAFGGHAGPALEQQGHAYLHSALPWIVLLLALAGGVFLRALGSAFRGECSVPRYAVSFTTLWLACVVCLFAIYVSQEFLEGLIVTGHPAGIAGILGYGGWWAVPAALAIGLVLAAVFHGGSWVLREIAQLRASRRRNPSPMRGSVLRVRDAFASPPAPLAAGWSGRGPPR